MSNINTNPINVNYPIPGNNNNSQGFRDNFASIKNNLNIAGDEITDLQTKVVVKSALNNTSVNNDMANTLISNASTRSFRATTYNLGSSLGSSVTVDVSLADVQYGTVTSDVVFNFANWAPSGTESNIELQLNISNSNAKITFPNEVIYSSNNYGITTLENYQSNGAYYDLTVPYGVTQLNYKLTTIDCGSNVTIEPLNRPRQATQIIQRTPSPVGFQGDTPGAICVDPSINQLTITNTTVSTDVLTTSGNTTQLYATLPVKFIGSTFGGITAGTTYYVKNVVSSNTFTVSTTLGGANVTLSNASGNMYLMPERNIYVCTDTYDATTYSRTVSSTTLGTDVLTLNSAASLVVNSPIMFSGTLPSGTVEANVVYYIKTISGADITLSRTRVDGVAGPTYDITSTTATPFSATIYQGSNIWKKTALTSW